LKHLPLEFFVVDTQYIMSTKLYGPDEGYEMVRRGSAIKKSRVSKATTKKVSMYTTVRGKISDLICDQEPVLSGPPFNPVVDLDSLSHDQFVTRANEVITSLNPEGHPPPGVYSPTMKNLIDRLEVSRMKDSQSYASVVKDGSIRSSSSSVDSYNGSVLTEDRYTSDEVDDIDFKETVVTAAATSPERATTRQKKSSPKKAVQKSTKKMKVSFAPLDMKNTSDLKSSQYAISTIQEKSAPPRRAGSREVILTERLGDFYTGNKKLTSSAVRLCAASEDDEKVDELREHYQKKEQRAVNRASMVRGKNSMVEYAADEALVTAEHVVNDEHVPKKRRTTDDYDQHYSDALYSDETPREEFKSQSTQELLLDGPPRPTTMRAIMERQSRIQKIESRKIVSNAVIAPVSKSKVDTGHNSALFYEVVNKNEVLQHIFIDYVEPQYHEDSLLWNENIGQEDFVLPEKDWDDHTLSADEQHIYNDAQ
jgi:hypothetical protein